MDLGEGLISNYTLEDQILDKILPWLQEKALIVWKGAVGVGLWASVIGCILMIIVYAATLDGKYKVKATVSFLSFFFIKILDFVI